MKKLLAILLALVMVFSLVACGGGKDAGTDGNDAAAGGNDAAAGGETGGEAGGGDPDRVLRIGFSQDRGTLDPMYMIGYDSLNAMFMVYEPLWDFTQEGEQVFVLATELDISNPTRWIVKLREGVTFANGNPLTAEDVVFSLEKGNNRTGEPAYLPELDLENTKALDEHTVEIAFFNYDMSYVYSMCCLVIFDAESYDAETIATTPNGTGPYQVDDYVINSHISMSAREGYWGEAPGINNLYFKVLAEDAQKTNSIETGEVDICAVPYQDVTYVQGLDGYNVQVASNAQARALYMNTSEHSVFFNNDDARMAVALAIDREAILNIVYSGVGEVSQFPLSKGNIGVKDSYLNLGVYGEGYNPEKAKQLAESSGLVNKTIKLVTNGSADFVTCAELIQSNLKEIGVAVEIVNYDAGSWLSVAFDPTAYDMCVDGTYVPSKTIAQNMSAWTLYHVGGAFANPAWPWVGQARYLELIDGIMAISDPAELDARYQEMIEIHSTALTWFSLVDMSTATAYSSDIGGWNIMNLGNVNYAKLYWAN